jgi:hypothetical protein
VCVLVEPGLLRAPVVLVAPVVEQLAQVVDRHAVLPAGAVDLIGEARPRQAITQVVQHGVVDADLEPLDVGHAALPVTAMRAAPSGNHACS